MGSRHLLVFLALVFLSSCAKKSNITNTIEEAIKQHLTAETYHSWQKSGLYYGKAVEEIYGQILEDPKVAIDFCYALDQQSDEELSVWNSYMQAQQNNVYLPCHDQLSNRLKLYRQEKLADLKIAYARWTACKDSGTVQKPCREKTTTSHRKVEVPITQGPIFFQGDLKPGEIALTFDDGPHPAVTQRVLQALQNSREEAHFFVLGQNAEKLPKLILQEQSNGHIVGNHSWNHENLKNLSQSKFIWQVESTFKTLNQLTGQSIRFFRFPYGSYENDQKDWLKNHETANFFWNIDTLDWKIKDPVKLYEHTVKVIAKKESGILLMHDIHPQTEMVLPFLLKTLQDWNYTTAQFVPKH